MYYFYFGVIPLPITPGAVTITTPSLNKTVVLINDGEVNILKSPGLKEISFKFLLPQQRYPFGNHELTSGLTAATYIPAIEQIKKSKVPFQFIVSRMKPNGVVTFHTNITCQIESFDFEEDADAYGLDVMCNITLKEYKNYGTKTFSIVDSLIETAVGAVVNTAVGVLTQNRSTASKQLITSVVVKAGDTLWNICKKHLGDGSKYKEIAKLNKLENANLIQVGQVLRLI